MNESYGSTSFSFGFGRVTADRRERTGGPIKDEADGDEDEKSLRKGGTSHWDGNGRFFHQKDDSDAMAGKHLRAPADTGRSDGVFEQRSRSSDFFSLT